MSRFIARSRCECQALLVAEVDDHKRVTKGTAIRDGVRERAPAHTMGAGEGERFDIGWLCPFCNRNTLRSFYAQALPPVAPPKAAP